MGSPEISVGGTLITILGHFFQKPVLLQRFFGDARENMATAHACGSARAYIFLKLTSMIVFVSKTNFEEIGEALVEIHLSTKNKEKKFKKETPNVGNFP